MPSAIAAAVSNGILRDEERRFLLTEGGQVREIVDSG
jgi:hypothetical protein